MAASHSLPVGYVLASPERRYKILKVLGQGGFGITYLATGKVRVRNITVDAQFAIKEHFVSAMCSRSSATQAIELSEPVASEVERQRRAFVREARRVQDLGIDHPNVVNINEVFEANNTAYYVMEYLGDDSLAAYVERHGALGADALRQLMGPIVDAVAELHRHHMAHYDIKPQNIMLAADDEDDKLRPVLIDFGLSKHYDDQGHVTSSIGAMGYTPGYAPVEQYGGVTAFSPAIDVYALSATIYFCLTGHKPEQAFAVDIEKIISELTPISGERMTRAIVHGMALRPADRIPDAPALQRELGWDDLIEPDEDMTSSDETVKLTDVTETVKAKRTGSYAGLDKFKEKIKWSVVKYAVLCCLAFASSLAITRMIGGCDSEEETTESLSDKTDISSTSDKPEASAAEFIPRTEARYLDLCASKDSVDYYFDLDEWNSLSQDEQDQYKKWGVVADTVGDGCIFSLEGTQKEYTWNNARKLYNKVLISQKEVDELEGKFSEIASRIQSFGGELTESVGYWTNTQAKSVDATSVYVWNFVDNYIIAFKHEYTTKEKVWPIYPLDPSAHNIKVIDEHSVAEKKAATQKTVVEKKAVEKRSRMGVGL